MPTLAELKAENAAEEAKAVAAETPKDPPEDTEPAAEEVADPPQDEDKGEETPDDKPADPADDKAKDKEPVVDDAWMKAEDQEPDVVHTGFDAKAIREKWKGRATAAENEAETLRKENEALKERLKAPVTTNLPDEPKREQFKTDAEYVTALAKHSITIATQQAQSEQAVAVQRQRMTEAQAKTAEAVDGHYVRAVELSKKSGIKQEAYQSADLEVRRAIESVFPNAGDAITDSLISRMGAGSEKVMYHLGVNAKKRGELVRLLNEDRNGLAAAVYLGKLNAELSIPAKRETKAPDPIDEVKGDKSGGKTGADRLKKEYQAAHEKGDAQKAFDIKRKAKNLKIDTSGWMR